jgi:transcriptional regulator with PAS, ATPase and Fis domain
MPLDKEILIVSDSLEPGTHEGCAIARDRDEAATLLSEDRFEAICLDRTGYAAALADARWLRKRRNRLPVLALIDGARVRDAAELLASGVEELIVRDSSSPDILRQRVASLRSRGRASSPPEATDHIVARGPAMRRVLELVAKAQHSDTTVLIQGETGTGKEVIARAVHRGGKRRNAPFVALNCAAFPETLLESELFGAERGAYTGAVRARRGHFEQAHGGTLFLDEIGETSLAFQAKLLRALQEGVVRPLGSTRETQVDVRVIAATNRELAHCVEDGVFRRDLFYRLNVFPIALPPLRSRSEDVVPLARAALARGAAEDAPLDIAPDAAGMLETYPWPGNVRELENEIARIVAQFSGEREVTARMLSAQIRGSTPAIPPDRGGETLRETMARFETWVLRNALERHSGRRIATARALGITRECLYKKMKRYQID